MHLNSLLDADCGNDDAYVKMSGRHYQNITMFTEIFMFDETSAEVCRHLCSKWLLGDEYATHGNYCAGVFYDTGTSQCSLVMGSDEYGQVIIALDTEEGVMFYQRKHCNASRVNVILTTAVHNNSYVHGSAGMAHWQCE